MSSWEWGICLTSFVLFWWKYGWSLQETACNLRQMYKRLEVIMTTQSLEPLPKPTGRKRFRNNFLSIPVTRTQFIKRNYDVHETFSAETILQPTGDLSFYKSLPVIRGRSDGDHSPASTSSDSYASCSACASRDEMETKSNGQQDMTNCLEYDTQGPQNPWYIRKLANFIYFWRKWYIGPQYHMVSLKDMMEDERVNQAVFDAAKHELRENPRSGTLDVLVEKHRLRAEKLIIDMRAKQPKHPYFSLYARFASWIIGKTLQRIYPSIFVSKRQLEVIRKARKTGHPILYLPIHRSHVDYVLVSWVLVASDIRSPVVAAGDNLNIPVFHMMMRSVGGFFIKRRLQSAGARDNLYRAILHSYMERSILDDNDLEFFIEGGRTRTGKPCIPKGGLLNIAMDTVLSGKVEDILIVPVNFSYDKLLEGNYVREQLGKTKAKESFLSAVLGLWNSIQTKFGNARIDFGQPFSVKEFIRSYKQWKSPSSLLQLYSCESCISDTDQNNNEDLGLANSDIAIEDRRDFISNLAQHVVYDGIKNLSLMSTNIISFLLLNKFREGVTMDKLAKELELLQSDLRARNHDLSIDSDMKEVIKHALTILGPGLVRRELIRVDSGLGTKPTQIFLKPVTSLPNVLELSYYSTCLIPIYAMESVIATCLLVLKGRELEDFRTMPSYTCHITDIELISTCLELCGILQNEFIFHPPCQTLEYTIRKSLDDLKAQGILTYDRSSAHTGNIEETDFSFRTVDLIYVNKDGETLERLKFLHGLITPILDTYAVSAVVLKRLVGCEAIEKHLQMDMLAEVKCHLQQQLIKYGESLALDPIRNFIKLLVGWEVLESYNNNYLTNYILTEAFDLEDSVDTVIRRVQRFQV